MQSPTHPDPKVPPPAGQAAIRIHATAPQTVSFRLTYLGLCALGSLAVLMGIMAITFCFTTDIRPMTSDTQLTGGCPIAEEARKLAERLQPLEDVARKEQDQELVKSLHDIRAKLDALQRPAANVAEVWSRLAETESAMVVQKAQLNVGLVDRHVQSFGRALNAAVAMQEVGKALEASQYGQASRALAKIDNPELLPIEAQTVAEQLTDIVKHAQGAGLCQLSAAAGEVLEGVRGDRVRLQRGLQTLARLTEVQARRKQVDDLLEAQLVRFSALRADCEGKDGMEGKSPSQTRGATSVGEASSHKAVTTFG